MLISHSSLLLFVTGAAVLLVIPGPAVSYVVSRSIRDGRAAGLVSVLGIVAGTLCHVVAAALGISAVLASSVLAFQFVKYLGAAYLIYLGIKTLRTPDQQLFASAGEEACLARIFGLGFFVNLLNPKTALFFLASLPQIRGSGARPRNGANPATGNSVRANGLVQRFGLCTDCWDGGRAHSWQLATAALPAQCFRRRIDRARIGVGILRRKIEIRLAFDILLPVSSSRR